MHQLLKGFQPYVRLADGTKAPDGVVFGGKEDGDFLFRTVRNNSARHLKIREIVLFETAVPFAGIGADTRFYGEGYQTRTQYSGVIKEPGTVGSNAADWELFRFPRYLGHQNHFSVYNLMCMWPRGGGALLLAFSSCRRFSGEIRFNERHLEMTLNAENLTLERGQAWALEEIAVLTGDSRDDVLKRLAARIGRNHPPMEWRSMPSAGWRAEADSLSESAKASAARMPELTFAYTGAVCNISSADWLAPASELSSASGAEFSAIKSAGYEPAACLSPFAVDGDSRLFRDHPEWLVQDEFGEPYGGSGQNGGYMLDGSNPAARAYLAKAIRTMRDKWNIRIFRLENLINGAIPCGCRYDRNATSVDSFRLAMKTIIEAAGDDCVIMAGGAPIWPLLGLCHSNQASCGVPFDEKCFGGSAIETFWRNWQHERLWINDPGAIVLEGRASEDLQSAEHETEEGSSEDENDFEKALMIASGGLVVSGDRLGEISDENIQALRKCIAGRGSAAVFDDETFRVGRIDRADRRLLILFNWENSARNITVPLMGRYAATDFWTGKPVNLYEGALTYKMQARSGKVFELLEA